MTAEHDIASLRDRIRTADDQYYNRGHSDLSDADYDESKRFGDLHRCD